MENQIIKVEDLQVGDEVIYASNGRLRRIKLIRPLVLAKARRCGGKYSSSKVQILNVYNLDHKTVIRTMYQDLNYKDLWLVKRKKNMRIVKHGGQLEIGDFVAISYATGFVFGWYCGYGQNTLQYFEYHWPVISLDQYNRIKKDPAYSDYEKANSEEFSKNWIIKNYVKDWRYRVMKIQDPEAIFTEQENLDKYREAKQILEQIKFI